MVQPGVCLVWWLWRQAGVWLHWQIPPLTWGSIRTSTCAPQSLVAGPDRASKRRCSPGLLLAAPILRRPDEQIPDGGGLNLIQPLRAFSRGHLDLPLHGQRPAFALGAWYLLRGKPECVTVADGRRRLVIGWAGSWGTCVAAHDDGLRRCTPSRNLIPASAVGRLEALASDVLRRRGLSARAGKGVVRVRARYFHAGGPDPASEAEQSTRDLGDDRKDH
jgi:hypothetical protein